MDAVEIKNIDFTKGIDAFRSFSSLDIAAAINNEVNVAGRSGGSGGKGTKKIQAGNVIAPANSGNFFD